MKFISTLSRTREGQWMLRHSGPDIGEVTATAPTRAQAIEKLKGEIRYRLELCPCSGESYQYIDVEIESEGKRDKDEA